jgi:pyrimidine-nucleoside phosphorylase
VRQALEILNGVETAPDYLECTLVLGGWMLKLAGLAKTAERGAEMMSARIKDRSGLRILREIVKAQNGDVRVIDNPDRLVTAKRSRNITAARDGYVTKLDARKIGHAGVLIAAGRAYKEQKLDYGAGLILEKKVGDRVRKGDTLAILRAADDIRLKAGEKEYREALEIGPKAPSRPPLVIEVLK